MIDNKAKTKSAMLHELESIKGLLLEEDDIPILQEVIAQQPPKANAKPQTPAQTAKVQATSTAAVVQPTKSNSPNNTSNSTNAGNKITEKTAAELANTQPSLAPETKPTASQHAAMSAEIKQSKADANPLGTAVDTTRPSTLTQTASQAAPQPKDASVVAQEKPFISEKLPRDIVEQQQDFFEALETKPSDILDTLDDLVKKTSSITGGKVTIEPPKPQSYRPAVKAIGENPFLPEHIRSRLHGNNPPPLFEFEAAKKIADVSKPVTQLGSLSFGSAMPSITKASEMQQDIIESLVKKFMPEIELELRQRLSIMSKQILEELNK